MASPTISLAALSDQLRGDLLEADGPAFDGARQLHNGMIDRRPSAIVRCSGLADIQAAVNFARSHNLDITVRGGGHNVAGKSIRDGALLIDLSPMQGVIVDPVTRRARAQGGVTWGAFDRETQVFGLATTGGAISSTGIAGLTLGGGLGWLMRRHGLACDNLRSAQVVLADGSCVIASETENADLFWALRGGGAEFGVVASFEYELHPVGPVVGGMLLYPLAAARDVLAAYNNFTRTAPDELTLYTGLITGPDASPLVGLLPCYCGPTDKGLELLRPLIAFGTPAVNAVAPMPYTAIQQQLDAGFPKGALNYWKSAFVQDLPAALLEALIDAYAHVPSPMSGIVIEQLGGAVAAVAPAATAFPHRNAAYNLLIMGVWQDPSQNAANIAWARDLFGAVQPYTSADVYVNYLDEDDIAARSPAAFGTNAQRLEAIKRKYDPTGLFAEAPTSAA